MDLMLLERYSTQNPTQLIEDFTSLIWTERYLLPGDFEMTTENPDAYRNIMLLGSLVAIRESGEVMMVESRNKKTDRDGKETLIIKGRSLDAFLENRVVPGVSGKKYQMNQQYTLDEAAAILIWNSVVNGTTRNVETKVLNTKYSADKIDNTIVSLNVRTAFSSGNRLVNPGQVLPEVQRFLARGDLGLKSIRGGWGGTHTRVSVDTTNTAARGTITRIPQVNTDDLRFEIYEGYNRTVGQSTNDPVVFSVEAGHFEDDETLEGLETWKTWALVTSSQGSINIWRNNTQFNYGGYDRRVLWVDGGSPAEGETATEFLADQPDVGRDALAKTTKTKMFDGKITTSTPYTFGDHYFLGDLVTIASEDQVIIRPMRVLEYIRTEDQTGSRGYPALMELEEE